MATISIEPGPGEGAVSLTGSLDADTDSGVGPRIAAHLPAQGDAYIDVSQLDLLDASGLQVLLDIAEGLAPASRLLLVQPSEPVRMALDESGILDSGKVAVLTLPFIWLG
jgi:anti-anti-sigma regulatory factor